MKEYFVTKEHLESMKERLEYLKVTGRPQAAEKIKAARDLGDLSENAEYDAAKEEQGFIEQEIRELDEKILHAVIIEENATSDTVSIGSTVTVKFIDDGVEDDEEIEYSILGTTEADVLNNKISNESPLGKALIGRKVNDVIDVETPNGGKVQYKIVKIK